MNFLVAEKVIGKLSEQPAVTRYLAVDKKFNSDFIFDLM